MVFESNMQAENSLVHYDAVAYYRLSKNDGDKSESDSISNQRKLIHSYVEKHENISIVDEAYDDGYTGTNYDRPGFKAVMAVIDSGRANCVIVKDLSRLGREYIETGRYLEMIFPSLGVRFIAINDDVDSDRVRSGDDIIVPVKNIMNESYCRELSKKLRKQFRIQRSNGEFMGAFASYGYRKHPDDKHKLVPDEFAAEIVRSIYQMKMKGYNQQAIADFLNGEGILAPAEYKRNQGLNYKTGFQITDRGQWTSVTVRRILENPIYIGTLVQGKRGTPNYKIKKMMFRDKDDWVTVENNHEAIVDPLIFYVVQKMLERDTRTSPQAETLQPLAGVLFCGDCGRAMCRRSVTRGNKKFYYYICSSYKRKKGCSSHSFEQKKLEKVVLTAIYNQIQVVAEAEALLEDVSQEDIFAIRQKRINMQIAQKHKEIDSYKDFRLKLYEVLNDCLIDREEYDKMRANYSQKVEKAQEDVVKLEKQKKELDTNLSCGRAWIEQFVRYQDIQALNREVVMALIDKVYVYEEKRIRIDFNYRNELDYYRNVINEVEKEVV